MLFESNFRYTAYVLTNESKETYESNDPTAIMAILDEYIEMFGEESGMIGLYDNSTGEIHFLKLHEYVFDHYIIDTYKSETFKSEFFKEYFE